MALLLGWREGYHVERQPPGGPLSTGRSALSRCIVTRCQEALQRFPTLVRMSHSDDAFLAKRAVAGDRDAFGALVQRYAAQARRVARALLRDPDDADDAAQDAFVTALTKLSRYDARRPFGPWLMRIVANAAIDRGRRRAVRRAEPLDERTVDGGEAPDQFAARGEWSQRLLDALAQLPDRQRLAVVLFDAEGYAHAEIADILGIPVGTVRSDVHRARHSLRAALGEWKESIE